MQSLLGTLIEASKTDNQFERGPKRLIRVNTAGSVDNGKSTLIGRLLFDSGGVPKDIIEKISAQSGAGDSKELNLALFTDGLKEEQARGITIDVARRYVSRDGLDLIIADTPGHQEFTRNMMTGTSTSHATLILVDATKGIVEQNRRHAYIASLLGVPNICVLVNKMDLVQHSQEHFNSLRRQFDELIQNLGGKPPTYIPISALHGDNVVSGSSSMPWYSGPVLMHYLESLEDSNSLAAKDLRFVVQWVEGVGRDTKKSEIVGSIASGAISIGDPIVVTPSLQRSQVESLHGLEGALARASFPAQTRLKLSDQINVRRGDVLTHPELLPQLSNRITAEICWMNEESLQSGNQYLLQVGSRILEAEVSTFSHEIDINTYQAKESKGRLELNEIARVEIATSEGHAWDSFKNNVGTGRFILIDKKSKATVAAGVVLSSR